jgi:hypothetical protein
MVGYVVVTSKDKNDADAVDYSPHEGQINSIVIDERSRFAISAYVFHIVGAFLS